VYPLKIGHVSDSGWVCLGRFDKDLDMNNPEDYFKELISYPVSHANEVLNLREIQENGFVKSYSNKRVLRSYL
jgi:hypothetical protein